jgi:Flp pilus assembly protein TadD
VAAVASFAGLALADRGAFAEAINEFRKAIEIDPAFVEAHTNLGIFLGQGGSSEEAVSPPAPGSNDRPDICECPEHVGKYLG